jgi:hypothetical protein
MASAVDIYVLSNDDNGVYSSNTSFGKIDSTTGAFSQIGFLPPDTMNITWNPYAGGYFFVTQDAGGSTNLRQLDPGGGLSVPIGSPIGFTMYGMAYRTSDSTLYGYEYNSDSTGTISPTNGGFTVLGQGIINSSYSVGGRYSIMNDTMYFAFNDSLNGADFGTIGYSASSTLQTITSNALYQYMVLANDGTTMYGIAGNSTPGQQRLYTIDVATGALTSGPLITGTAFDPATGLGLGTYFHGAGIVPVPEPSTYALAAIATGVMAAIARRRKARKA